jgi:proline dehydrogenase
MESSAFTEKTIRIYLDAHSKHPHVGIALQAYMRRSGPNLRTLLDSGAKIRLVKGAYRESHDIVYSSREGVSRSFTELMQTLFERGQDFAIATHDSALVDQARRMAESRHVEFRFEMLKGIRNELKEDLVRSGYKVYEYLPYGDRWFAYSWRRMTEHPSNVWLLLRSLV